jgi:pyruvate formate lyase activating enzyme
MEAYLYELLADKKVKCNLCSHRCVIKAGRPAGCKRWFMIKSLRNMWTPSKKNPCFIFCRAPFPIRLPLSAVIFAAGLVTPQEIVAAADKSGCRSISYTYTEPTVFFEFAYDTAKIAHERGIRNVFVTNGYMTAEALEMIDPYLDAANVDLKAFRDRYYKDLCGARLEHVQEPDLMMTAPSLRNWPHLSPMIWEPRPPGTSAAFIRLIN